MGRARAVVILVVGLGFFSACLLLATGCSRSSESDMMAAAGLILEHQLSNDYREWQNSWWHPVWEDVAGELAVIDDARMPAWAVERYELCVYWENAYSRRDEIPQKGPDLVVERKGIGWGWLLINRKLEHHVLERGLTFSKREDGIEVQSASKVLHSAWTDPEGQE